jgi:hypothetical protein
VPAGISCDRMGIYFSRLLAWIDLQPVPLANRQDQLSGSVEPSASSTRQTPVYLLHLVGSPEIDWLEALQPYVLLRSVPAQASNKCLRQWADSYLAPTWPFTTYVCTPAPGPCWIRSPPALPASSPPPLFAAFA